MQELIQRRGGAASNRRQVGSVLFDGIMGLLVIMILIGAVMVLVGQARTSRETSQLKNRVELVIQEIHSQYGQNGDFSTISMGSYDAARGIMVGGLGGRSLLDASVFRDMTLVQNNEGAGYCLNIFEISQDLCEHAGPVLGQATGLTPHAAQCVSEQVRLRLCRYPEGA